MTPDPRIEWLRENVPGFKAMNDQVLKAEAEEKENRQKFASHMVAQARREQ